MFHLCGITAWCLMAVVCALGTAVTAKAQNVGLDIRMPKVDKVIVMTADGVNLRKAPSATAPRLMYEEGDMSDYWDYFWSNQRKGGKAVSFRQDCPIMVINETSEWYGVVYSDIYQGQRLVYVSKKFAKEVELTPITPEFLNTTEYYAVTSGIYRGYFMGSFWNMGDSGLFAGRIINGLAVYNHGTVGWFERAEDGLKRFKIEKDFLKITYGSEVSIQKNSGGETYTNFDVTKLTTNEFGQIVKRIKDECGGPSERSEIYCNYNGELRQLTYFSPTETLFKDIMVSYPANLPTTPEIANPNDPKPVQPYRISKVNPKCNYEWRGLSVKEVLITHEGMLLKMEFDNRLYHEEWININRQATVSIPGTSIKAKLTHKKDIEVSPGKTLIGPNEVKTFYLQFEPLPKDTRVFDFHETPTSRWKITGISVQ